MRVWIFVLIRVESGGFPENSGEVRASGDGLVKVNATLRIEEGNGFVDKAEDEAEGRARTAEGKEKVGVGGGGDFTYFTSGKGDGVGDDVIRGEAVGENVE